MPSPITMPAITSPTKLPANGTIPIPIAMIPKLGTEANFRPKRSIRIPAGKNIDMSTIADTVMIVPTWAGLSESSVAPTKGISS